MNTEILKSVINEGKQLPPVKQQQIELGFFSERQDSVIDLAAEGSSSTFSLTEDGETYFFNEPIFVRSIKTESSSKDSVKIGYETMGLNSDSFTEETAVSETDDSPISTCQVNKFIKALRVKSNSDSYFFRNQRVRRLLVDVISPNDLLEMQNAHKKAIELKAKFDAEMENQVKTLEAEKTALDAKMANQANDLNTQKEKLKADRDAFDQKVQTAQAQIKENDEKIKATDSAIADKEAKLKTTNAELEETKRSLSASKSQIEELEVASGELSKKIDERTAEYTLKTQQVTKVADDLKRLNNDVSLFSDDVVGFTRQGDSQIKKYSILLGAILLVAVGLVVVSIHSTYQIYDTFVNKPEIGVGSLLAIKGFLLLLLYYAGKFLYQFAKPFIVAILTIDQRKLSLKQITILAREFSDSAMDGSTLTEEERLKVRMQTRLHLIKEYLGGAYDGEKPEFNVDFESLKLADIKNLLPLKDATPSDKVKKAE